MLYARIENETKVPAATGLIGRCPQCNGVLRPKCGSVYVHHWAHLGKDCDPWSEPEGPWHRAWKGHFHRDCQEVTVGPHRADIKLPSGLVVELQHSSISVDEIAERERFYKNMIWVFDATGLEIGKRDVEYFPGDKTYGNPDFGGTTTYDQKVVNFTLLREHLKNIDTLLGRRMKYAWRRAKPSVLSCAKCVYLDIDSEHIMQLNWAKSNTMTIYGTLVTKKMFLDALKLA